MTETPKQTDERLRSWLDANQLARERMCQAILSVDGRFSNVNLRQPRGGPDGARDLEAKFENETIAWIAIGFRNSASDSKDDRSWVKRKFTKDINSARDHGKELKTFGFMTNVYITANAKDKMRTYANELGFANCFIFDREHLRVILDSPDGMSFRYQYLAISLSDAEQAAFFGKWGKRLEDSIADMASSIDLKMSRIQFFLESNRPLKRFSFHFVLDEEYATNYPSHFRITSSIIIFGHNKRYLEMQTSSCDETKDRPSSFSAGKHNCVLSNFRTQSLKNVDTTKDWVTISSGTGVWPDSMATIIVRGEHSQWVPNPDSVLLCDLDEAWHTTHVNASLADKIVKLRIFANEYLIQEIDRSDLSFSDPNKIPEQPWDFSEAELADPWVRVMGAFGSSFSFSSKTPTRFFQPTTSGSTES